MDVKDYLEAIKTQQIPTEPPDGLDYSNGFDPGRWRELWEARDFCTRRGLWTVIDQVWTKALADWIGSRVVLEIMAGGGWLAKALNDHGVKITATDDFTWNGEQHSLLTHVYPVQGLGCLDAIAHIPADILLVSWPPYESQAICSAANAWGTEKPIIYIGEGNGGCNAPDEFFEQFRTIPAPSFPMRTWDGLHDGVAIGRWTKGY